MNRDARDPGADDLFVDHCLEQELGGATPPDLAARIARASPERLAGAAARLDAATPPPRARLIRRTLLVAAAASVLFAAGALWMANRTPSAPPTPPAERFLALLDEFQRRMPVDPAALRSAERRREIAPAALPAIREILALDAAHPEALGLGRRILEFEAYATMLGDDDLRRDLERRAQRGDASARAALATARVTLATEDDRTAALEDLAAELRDHPELEGTVTQALVTAELTVAEAETLAATLSRADVARALVDLAERATNGPRRLLGRPLDLFGRLLDNSLLSTKSLQGDVVLVCFWASWCQPSTDVLAEIQDVRADHPELQVLGVSCDHDFGALRAFVLAHPQYDWPLFFDRNAPGWHELALDLGVRTLPLTLVLDRDGVVREVPSRSEIESAVRRQLVK